MNSEPVQVTIVGLGYVGLPLAIALATSHYVTGFDVDTSRIDELKGHFDRTNEVSSERLATSSLKLTHSVDEVEPSEFFVVTVPTPIDAANTPDLGILESASRMVGRMLLNSCQNGKRPVVVYESTVYPGVTEEICIPILEQVSGLQWKTDFFVGYSPERINPGDKKNTVDAITKVVAGDSPETLDRVEALYKTVTKAGTFRAASIKTAEAAKVIENAQRDINIAFMNEITQIFALQDLSIWDVLEAANTKWNFLPFVPGLVGGHCIGVDPYYLAHKACLLNHDPVVVLAGRGVNDGMASWIADRLQSLIATKKASILILGLTFKEDVPDIRNSKVFDLAKGLAEKGHTLTFHDPLADPRHTMDEYGIEIDADAMAGSYDLVVIAVPHREYREMGANRIAALAAPGGYVADLKKAFAESSFWTL